MARKWTEEERRKQAEAIRRWQPWTKSTGPKTRAGKERTRLNAATHGKYMTHWKVLRYAMRLNRRFTNGIDMWLAADAMLQRLDTARRVKESKYKETQPDQGDKP